MIRIQNSATQGIVRLIPLLCLALLIGCNSSPDQELGGLVTLDGSPLETGQIEFTPTSKSVGPTAGSIIEKGRYRIPAVAQGLKVGGEYRVSITSMAGNGKWAIHPTDPAGKREVLENIIPERYNTESELTATIHRGDSTLDFDLKSTP